MEGKKKLKIIVTAGPTHEPIDIVRFMTNKSTGVMGYSLAQVAAECGHEVILISGPTNIKNTIPEVNVIQVQTAGQMYETVKKEFYESDVLIMAAAVCDFRPKNPETARKIKKEEGIPVFELEKTPDILERLKRIKEKQLMVGFALEMSDLEKKAKEKLEKKKLDLIVANKITASSSPFGEKGIDVLIIDKSKNVEICEDISKIEVARRVMEKVEELKTHQGKIQEFS